MDGLISMMGLAIPAKAIHHDKDLLQGKVVDWFNAVKNPEDEKGFQFSCPRM